MPVVSWDMNQIIIPFNTAIEQYIQSASLQYKNKKILDIGCGTGYYTRFFGVQNDVTGIDLLSCVEKRYKNFRFVKGDATALPFPKESFELVVSFDVIEHIENDRKMVSEAYRVLKKGGQLLIGTPNRDRLIHVLLKLIGRPVQYPLYIGHYDDLGDMIHVREYTMTDLEGKIKKSGFTNVEILPFWFGLTALEYGFLRTPKILAGMSQYLFARACK